MPQFTFIPDDVLFCRDGRPMTGSSTGHGAQLPMPHVLHSALLAAFHRSYGGQLPAGANSRQNKVQPYDNLLSAGPWLLDKDGQTWLPRPEDLGKDSNQPVHRPLEPTAFANCAHSMPNGLRPIVSTRSATKEKPGRWISRSSLEACLADKEGTPELHSDADFFDKDHTLGIGIDPATETTLSGQIYTAERLRLHEGVKLAAWASLPYETADSKTAGDAVRTLFAQPHKLIIGGEQRVTSVTLESGNSLANWLPRAPSIVGTKVKFTLLSPAINPRTENDSGDLRHCGGWLPSWIKLDDSGRYRVQLKSGIPPRDQFRDRKSWRFAVDSLPIIGATLVTALVPKPLIITGWAISSKPDEGGARSTLLAAPAGSVYYFEADNTEQAQLLAAALNWHGASTTGPLSILNRRTGLLGEKGYGLGVCSSWQYHSDVR